MTLGVKRPDQRQLMTYIERLDRVWCYVILHDRYTVFTKIKYRFNVS